MTTFGTPGHAGSLRRGDGLSMDLRALGRLPELYPTDAVFNGNSPGVELADAMGKALGLGVGIVAGQIERQDIERAQQDERDRAWSKVWIGEAEKGVQQVAPKLQEQIQNRRLMVPDGMPVADFAEQIIERELEGVEYSGDAREHFAARLRGPLNGWLTEQHATIKRENEAGLLESLSQRFDDPALTAEEAAATWAEAKRLAPGWTDAQVYDAVTKPAAERAVAFGDVSLIPDIFAGVPQQFRRDAGIYTLKAEARAREFDNKRAQAARNALYGMASSGASLHTILEDLGKVQGSIIPHEEADELRRHFVRRAQTQNVTDIQAALFRGVASAKDIEPLLQRAVTLPEEDAQYIDPVTAQSLRSFAQDRARHSLARDQALSILGGGPGSLTESQHGSAVAEVLGPEGVGYIDAANRIAKPQDLATSLLRARFVPKAVHETLIANLMSPNVGESQNAALAIGMLTNGSSRAYADMIDAAGSDIDPLITAARDQYARGRLQDATTAPQALQAIQNARQANQPTPRPSAEVVADIRREAKIDPLATLDEQAEKIVRNVRQEFPHTKDFGLFHTDWLWPDPTLEAPEQNITRRVEAWFANRFEQLRTRLPREQALDEAKRYAAGKVRNSVDFVRWNGTVVPVAIDLEEGLRLPEALRWGEGFEDEAKDDLRRARFDPDEVATLRPYLDPATPPGEDPTARMGWVYITDEGDEIRDDAGRLIVYRPTDKAADANARFRQLLDQKEAEFITNAENMRLIRATRVESALNPNLPAIQTTLGPKK
jgi:hypothetical protein